MQPSFIRPPLSITNTLPGWLCCIASRNTSTLPKCWAGRTSPAIRVPGTTGLIPGGAIRNAIFRRSAASATSGVESSLKVERDCCFTRPKNHGIEKSKIRNQLPSLKTTACRKLCYCGRRLKLPSPWMFRLSTIISGHQGRDAGETFDEKCDANWGEVACAVFRVWRLHVRVDYRAPFVSRRRSRFTLATESGSACCFSTDGSIVDFAHGSRGRRLCVGCDWARQKREMGPLARDSNSGRESRWRFNQHIRATRS